MFSIHVIDRHNRDRYAKPLEDYFRIRHDIYVVEQGWTGLTPDKGVERDQFDTEEAVYLLGIAPDGAVVAGSRFIPTTAPHLMSEIFPGLAAKGVPRADDIYEWTRVFVVPEQRTPGRPSLAAGIVYCGILEFCLEEGISMLTVVCQTWWERRFQTMGWTFSRLGETAVHDGESLVGLKIGVTLSALQRTREVYGIWQSVIGRDP